MSRSTETSFECSLGSRARATLLLLIVVVPGLIFVLTAIRIGAASVLEGRGSLSDLQKAAALDPVDPEVYRRLGVLECYVLDPPNYTDSLRHLRRATELAPLRSLYWSNLGAACETSGDRACADAAFERLLSLDPMMPRSYWVVANHYLRTDRSQDALAQFRRLLELGPDSGYAERTFQLCLQAANDPDAVFRQVLAGRKDPELGLDYVDYLGRHGQSERAVRHLWDLFGLPALNLPASEASLSLAAKVFQTGLLERSDAADIGVPAVPLIELHGRPARTALERAGADVRLGAKVQRVLASADGSLDIAEEGGGVRADAVILATPHDRVGGLLPGGALPDPGVPSRLGTSPIVNLHVVYDRRVTAFQFAAAVDSPVQWVFDRSSPAGLTRGQYLALSLSGAEEWVEQPVQDLRETFLPALTRLFPGAGAARVERFLVTRERAATFRQAPGTAALRPGSRTGLTRLFLAGAWTDTGWPATMEGAVRSGLTAARLALVALGRTERLPAEVAA